MEVACALCQGKQALSLNPEFARLPQVGFAFMWPSSHLDRLCCRVRVNDIHKIDAIQVSRDALTAVDPSRGAKHRLTCGEVPRLHDGPRSPLHSLRDGIGFHLDHIHKISHLCTM